MRPMVEGPGTSDPSTSGTAGRPWSDAGTADWPEDPVDVLARIFALRQMADLGGFPHLPEWDRKEAWAKDQLGPAHAEPATGAPIPSARPAGTDPHVVADPFLAFAELSAARLVADEQGLVHAKAWDDTEEEVREQLRRAGTGGATGLGAEDDTP